MKKKKKKKKRVMIILKSESKPDERGENKINKIKKTMMIKIWFRYRMNNEVFK